MKRKLTMLLYLTLFMFILTSCEVGSHSDEVTEVLGLDVSTGTIISDYDTHGGFHGDGTTCIVYSFGDDTVLNDIINSSDWNKFPLDDTVQALVYGISDKTSQTGPFLTDNEGNPIVPEILNGYYLLIDRQNDADGDILDRYSFNFTLGLYDTDTNTLYFCKLDT